MIAVRDRIMDCLHEHCPDEQQEIDIMIALQEGLANAVLHGSGNGKIIRCSLQVTPEAITIVIRDSLARVSTLRPLPTPPTTAPISPSTGAASISCASRTKVTYRHGGSDWYLKKLRTTQR